MATWQINSGTLVDIADAVRAKRGTSSPIQVDELADEIALIDSGAGLLRDRLIIPDKYNTGCHGELTKFDITTDTSGIRWRDSSTTIDFNNGKGIQNLAANQVIVFENYDFTDYTEFYFLNVQSYTTSSTYYRSGLKFVFKNCLFNRIRQDYEFNSDVNISLEFYNCSTNRIKAGNAVVDRCLIGNVTYYQEKDPTYSPDGDTVNPKGAFIIKNSYIMDIEAVTATQGAAHIDGFQVTYNPDGHDVHIFNCRFECFDMPYPASQGNWSYSLFWQGDTINSSVEYCILHGGGIYGVSVRKAENQYLANNLVSGEYHCAEGAPESDWVRVCYPADDVYQMSDNWADYIRTLLVSSVWVENGKIKICYSNNMHSVRTMRIVTDNNDTYTVSVPSCPIRDTAASEGITKWSDLPFDLVTEIDMAGVHSLDIYDGNTLVRTFVVDAASNNPGEGANLGTKTITQNGTYSANDDELDGYSEVTVNVGGSGPTGTISISQNGVYNVSQYANASVNVYSTPRYLSIQDVTPSENTNTITVQYQPAKNLIGIYCYDLNRENNDTYTMATIAWYKHRDNSSTYKFGTTINYQGNDQSNISYGNVTVDSTLGIITLAAHDSRFYWRSNRSYRVILIYEESSDYTIDFTSFGGGLISSNTTNTVANGESYTTTVSVPDSNYTIGSIVVTMDGVDITSTVYNSSTHVISIPSVTGDLVIAGTATNTYFAIMAEAANIIPVDATKSIEGSPLFGNSFILSTADTEAGVDIIIPLKNPISSSGIALSLNADDIEYTGSNTAWMVGVGCLDSQGQLIGNPVALIEGTDVTALESGVNFTLDSTYSSTAAFALRFMTMSTASGTNSIQVNNCRFQTTN